MSFRRFYAVLRKEWQDLRQNRMVLLGLAVVPLALTAIGLLTAIAAAHAPMGPKQISELPEVPGVEPRVVLLTMIVDPYLALIMLTPAVFPSTIAAHSVVGERQMRSLEPLLATPIRVVELLAAKTVAAVIFPVVIGWISYGVILLGLLVGARDALPIAARPGWLLTMALLSPLLALSATFLGVLASSRADDPRTAQSAGAVLLLPLSLLAVAVALRWIELTVTTVSIFAAVAAIGAAALALLSKRLFAREAALTRWR